ncbi:MAG: hypothetical protein SGPRY_000144 [Prymnesium sp.]
MRLVVAAESVLEMVGGVMMKELPVKQVEGGSCMEEVGEVVEEEMQTEVVGAEIQLKVVDQEIPLRMMKQAIRIEVEVEIIRMASEGEEIRAAVVGEEIPNALVEEKTRIKMVREEDKGKEGASVMDSSILVQTRYARAVSEMRPLAL